MKWLLIVIGLLVGLAVLVLIVGALRPASHVATLTYRVAASPDSVFRVISDVEAQPRWTPEITKVERLPDNAGRPAYRENFGGFEAMTVITESVPDTRLVKEILPTGPFYGTWTWELVPDGAGTRLTITERGTVGNPFFRGMMVFHDNQKTIRQYVAALGRRLNAAVTEP